MGVLGVVGLLCCDLFPPGVMADNGGGGETGAVGEG